MPPQPSTPADLTPLRKEIESLDRELVALLNKRLEVSGAIGAVKRRSRSHSHPFDPDREESLLRLLTRENPGPLSAASLRAIYREIFSSSRARQSPLTIGYLDGPHDHADCAHHTPLLAACSRFGVEENYCAVPRVKTLLKETAAGHLTLSLLCPGVLAAHGAEIGKHLYVCGEIPLRGRLPVSGKGKGTGKKTALPFYILTRRETEPAATPLVPGTRLLLLAAGLGKKPSLPALQRWCRAHGARFLYASAHDGAALIDIDIPAIPLPPLLHLEETLRHALGAPAKSKSKAASQPRLLLLGAYLAEEATPHGHA